MGEVSAIELRVTGREALDFWAERLAEFGVEHGGVEEQGGRGLIAFTDPEGQRLRLVDDGGDDGVAGGIPWEGSPVPRVAGVRGLGAVELTVRDLAPTAWVLSEVLGFRKGGRVRAGAMSAPSSSRSGRAGPGRRCWSWRGPARR